MYAEVTKKKSLSIFARIRTVVYQRDDRILKTVSHTHDVHVTSRHFELILITQISLAVNGSFSAKKQIHCLMIDYNTNGNIFRI